LFALLNSKYYVIYTHPNCANFFKKVTCQQSLFLHNRQLWLSCLHSCFVFIRSWFRVPVRRPAILTEVF